MLSAILHGKAARVSIEGENISWRELFRRREDLLTAAIFGRFSYLSSNGMEELLRSLLGDGLVDLLGPYEFIKFWPRYGLLKSRRYVEPDVVLHFSNAVLVVEVKPPHSGTQSAAQWSDEIGAIIANRKSLRGSRRGGGHIVLLALGRRMSDWREKISAAESRWVADGVRIVAIEWQQVLSAVSLLDTENCATDRAVVNDWLAAFQLFGLDCRLHSFGDLAGLAKSLDPDSLNVLGGIKNHPGRGFQELPGCDFSKPVYSFDQCGKESI